MTTLRDIISFPPEVKNTILGLFLLLLLLSIGSNLYAALKTGVAQRLSSTPKYMRSEQPVRFWFLIIFYMMSVILFTALLVATIARWHDDRVF